MKKCTTCLTEKPITEFFFRDQKTGRRHCICKQCKREVDKKCYIQSESRRIKMRITAKRATDKAWEFVKRVRQKSHCRKCKENRWYVLDFHHIKGIKKYNISAMLVGCSIRTIKNEIRKCEVLCANCHREEHYLKGEEANSVEAQV